MELSELAKDILKTIEREDAFEESKKKGGFVKLVKAKDAKEVLLWKLEYLLTCI